MAHSHSAKEEPFRSEQPGESSTPSVEDINLPTSFFEGARVPVLFVSPDGRLLDANSHACETMGFAEEEVAGTPVTALLPDGREPACREALQRAVEQGRSRFEGSLLTSDGTPMSCTVEWTCTEHEGTPLLWGTVQEGSDDAHRRTQPRSEQFQLLVEKVEEYAIFMLDPEGHVATWNEGAERIKGYTEEEILGTHFSTFYPEEAVEAGRPEEGLETAAREGQWVDEGWRVRKDGSRFWARVTITALYDDKGRLRGFGKVTRDMTDRRRRIQALRTAEQKYRRLFEESQEAISVTSPTGEILDVNPAACEQSGYSREELLEMNISELYADPDDRRALISTLRNEGGVRSWEVCLQRKGGEEVICQVSATAWQDEDGEMEAVQSFARDVTDRKKAREALKESEEKFRALAQDAPVGIGLVEEDEYRYVNPAYADIVGYEQEDLIGRSPEALFHPDDWPMVEGKIRQRVEEEVETVQYRARVQTESGETRHVEVHGTRIEHRGRPVLIGTMQDITDRLQLQEELLQIQDEERARIGQEMHDGVGALLTAAGIQISSLAREAKQGETVSPDDLEKTSEFVRQAAEEARALSHGLSPVEMEEGFCSALEKMADRMDGQKEVECTFEADGGIDESGVVSEEVARHLYRIAQEALNNAIKHAEPDQIQIRVARIDDETLELAVEDDGVGFSPCSDEEGIGLRTMRRRAALIDGSFAVEEGSDGGTIVRCRVPLGAPRR